MNKRKRRRAKNGYVRDEMMVSSFATISCGKGTACVSAHHDSFAIACVECLHHAPSFFLGPLVTPRYSSVCLWQCGYTYVRLCTQCNVTLCYHSDPPLCTLSFVSKNKYRYNIVISHACMHVCMHIGKCLRGVAIIACGILVYIKPIR